MTTDSAGGAADAGLVIDLSASLDSGDLLGEAVETIKLQIKHIARLRLCRP